MPLQNAIRAISIAEVALAELLPPAEESPLLTVDEVVELIASLRLARSALWPLLDRPLRVQLTFPRRPPAERAFVALEYALVELRAFRRQAPPEADTTIAGAAFVVATACASIEVALEPWSPEEVIELAQLGVQ